jgi:beta-lactamase regulating signal transducer with metallopeptidase domain
MGWLASSGTLGLIVEYFLKTTIVLTPALLAAAASKRRPAAFRHSVLSFALVGLLLLPLLSLAPVGWRTSLLPPRPATARTHSRDVRGPMREAVEIPGITLSITASGPAGSPTELPALHAALRTGGFASPPPSGSRTSPLPEIRADARSRAGWLDLAVAVLWPAGLVVLVLRLAFGLAGAAKLTREAAALGDPVWRVLLERFLSLVALRRKIRLKSHPQVLVPLTWGWRKPVVLMPADTDAWTEEERSSALYHELSHVKRADFLVMLLVRVSLAAFWFNPLCWIVYRELRKEQEIACDELVLRAGIRPSTYAASLLAFRRSAGFRWNPSAALLGMLGRSSFPERLAAILKQKLIFKEVKMRTKITLAAAVVLAVAMIGTARPAVGVDKTVAKTALVETAVPASGSLDVIAPPAVAQETQAEKAVVQEKEKEKAKAEKKVDVTIKGVGKTPIVITITEGDTVKTLTLDKPLTITSGKDGHILVLTSEGKDIQVLKGEPLRLEIKGGEIQVLKEGIPVKVGESGVYTIVKEGESGKDGIKVVVEKAKDVKPTIVWTVREPGKEGKEGALWVAKEFSAEPVKLGWVSEGGKGFTVYPVGGTELLEKVRQMQEQVEAIKAKKLDLSALEESLKKLEEELKAREAKLGEFKLDLVKEPGELSIAKEIDEATVRTGVWIYEDGKARKATVGIEKDDNTIQIVDVDKGTTAKDFERVVARLKKDLPEGYSLIKQEFDQENGTMVFKIAPAEGKKVDEKVVRKLVDSLKDELKSQK